MPPRDGMTFFFTLPSSRQACVNGLVDKLERRKVGKKDWSKIGLTLTVV